MKRILSILLFIFIAHQAIGQQMATENTLSASASLKLTPEIAIIPEPVSLVKHQGHFTLPENVLIQATASPGMKPVTDYLQEKITAATGKFVTSTHTTTASPTIRLILNSTANKQLGKEGYQLNIKESMIVIKANQESGLFYGIQTLLQLFPKEIEAKEPVEGMVWKAPCVEIIDYPLLSWRGLMFDVSRHFFTKDEVKQYIDAMVRYKFNLLHLHLTDNEGWRLEIKGLPKLTEIGAWNVKKVGNFGNFPPAGPEEPRDYGGFYTQEEMKELVKYAQDRFVNIMPEIDVPGHSLAIIAAYPELSCTPGADKYRVRSGEKIMDWTKSPVESLIDNTLCPANEKVYQFLDTVLTQVAAIFPFEYIHMGGDETPRNFWAKSPQVLALMKREGFKNFNEVQNYFEKRTQKIVESKGKKFMGWDEILKGDLSSSAAIMAWRGEKYGVEAAKRKYKVVMTPYSHTYLDFMQSDEIGEPKVYETLRLSKAYEFNPIPTGVDASYILGGQANLWTEQVYNIRQAEYMTWPRGLAIAESVWSPKDKKNWVTFFPKVEQHFKRLDVAETKYAPSVYDPIFKVSRNADKKLLVDLSTEVEGLDIYYSFDNSYPDHFYPKYTGPLTPPGDATLLRVITYKGKKPVGRMLNMPVEELNKRAPKK